LEGVKNIVPIGPVGPSDGSSSHPPAATQSVQPAVTTEEYESADEYLAILLDDILPIVGWGGPIAREDFVPVSGKS
jgi:hypothetical protein